MNKTFISTCLLIGVTAPCCLAAVPCQSWRPKTVRLPFPGDCTNILMHVDFDGMPCGDYPGKKDLGGRGRIDAKTGKLVSNTHVYVTNADAVSKPNALIHDFDDDPEFPANGLHGFTVPLTPSVTNGWCYLGFDFKLISGFIDLEMRGYCAGYHESKESDAVSGNQVGFQARIGSQFQMQFPNASGGGVVGPIERGRWYRLNMWTMTQGGCPEGVQFGGWLRLDEIAADGSVVKGEPTRYGSYQLIMKGPWTYLGIVGRGRVRYLFDNIDYGRQ